VSQTISQRAAALLVAARETGTPIQDLPDELRPTTLAEAYAIQVETARMTGPIGGWKVVLPPAGETPKTAPIAASQVLNQDGRWTTADSARLEVELALSFKSDLPKRALPYERHEVSAAIAAAHVAFEILGSRYIDRRSLSQFSVLADGQVNAGMALGPAIAPWPDLDAAHLAMSLSVDGKPEASTDKGASNDQVLDAMTWLVNHAAEHFGGVRAGQAVLTGARIGPVEVPAGRVAEGRSGDAVLRMKLVAA
jgi:2-keto-4-pentenoate hydratase